MEGHNVDSCYRIADIGIAIKGAGKFADAFRKYFRSEEIVQLEGKAQLEIWIEDKSNKVKIKEKIYSLLGTIAFTLRNKFTRYLNFGKRYN